jgi:hypothetical protein
MKWCAEQDSNPHWATGAEVKEIERSQRGRPKNFKRPTAPFHACGMDGPLSGTQSVIGHGVTGQ